MYGNLASPVSRATARAQRDPAFPDHMNGPNGPPSPKCVSRRIQIRLDHNTCFVLPGNLQSHNKKVINVMKTPEAVPDNNSISRNNNKYRVREFYA